MPRNTSISVSEHPEFYADSRSAGTFKRKNASGKTINPKYCFYKNPTKNVCLGLCFYKTPKSQKTIFAFNFFLNIPSDLTSELNTALYSQRGFFKEQIWVVLFYTKIQIRSTKADNWEKISFLVLRSQSLSKNA